MTYPVTNWNGKNHESLLSSLKTNQFCLSSGVIHLHFMAYIDEGFNGAALKNTTINNILRCLNCCILQRHGH